VAKKAAIGRNKPTMHHLKAEADNCKVFPSFHAAAIWKPKTGIAAQGKRTPTEISMKLKRNNIKIVHGILPPSDVFFSYYRKKAVRTTPADCSVGPFSQDDFSEEVITTQVLLYFDRVPLARLTVVPEKENSRTC